MLPSESFFVNHFFCFSLIGKSNLLDFGCKIIRKNKDNYVSPEFNYYSGKYCPSPHGELLEWNPV